MTSAAEPKKATTSPKLPGVPGEAAMDEPSSLDGSAVPDALHLQNIVDQFRRFLGHLCFLSFWDQSDIIPFAHTEQI